MNNHIEKRPGYDDAGQILASEPLRDWVRGNLGETLLLSFSCGKDSLASWLFLRDHFKLIPYFLYWIPGLSFVEDALAYYEDYFGQHILRLPHPIFYQYLTNLVYQPPDQVAVMRALDLPTFDFADVDEILSRWQGEELYTAVGFRMKDGIDRRNMLLQKGPIGTGRRRYYWPIWDWDIQRVADEIKRHNVKLPADYKRWGRTLAAFDYQYLKPIQRYFPEDYERIREWFPLIDLELFRYEQVGKWPTS